MINLLNLFFLYHYYWYSETHVQEINMYYDIIFKYLINILLSQK